VSERFKVDLRGIIDLAANHLYTSPDVFVREVIQNAVDAVTARRRLDPAHRGSVRLELTPGGDGEATLCVSDDGIGLTLPEIHMFLSTVGGSSKRDDAERAAEKVTEDVDGFLGRFGIGLLSCFMVTDEIVVVTRSARSPEAGAVEWKGRADGSYSVRELADSRVPSGTSVYLKAKPEADSCFERERVIELARTYAEMLPTPVIVSVAQDDVPINQAHPPWEIDSSDEVALIDLCEQSLGFRPIDMFRISAPAGGVEGYAFIRSSRDASWGGSHKLYAHGMYVGDQVTGLVPRWATFVGCVLNTTGLRLTASRESVHHDAALDACSEEIGAAIRARLAHLLRHDRDGFERVMGVHDTEIRGLAVKDAEFFALVIDLLEFDTTLGRIRFGEFRREHDRLLVARTAEQFRRLSPIAAAAGVRVFNGGYTYHEELLGRAIERHPEIELRAFDSADLVDMWEEPPNAEDYRGLLAAGAPALEKRECELLVRTFGPSQLPAFFALGADAEFHRQLDRTKSRASGLWNEILNAMAPRPEVPSRTRLCLNTNSTLVRRLAALTDPELQRTAVEILYVQALMSGQHALSTEEVELLHDNMERLLLRCVDPREPL